MNVEIRKEQLLQNGIFVGDRESLVFEIEKVFAREFPLENEYFKVQKFEISVDDVRDARAWIYANSSDAYRVVILSSFYWNLAVQNALLKVLEQSPSYAKIFLITESVDVFLKTILSRIFVHTLESSDDLRQLAEKVLKMESYLRLQDSKLKKLLAAKVENVNQAYGAATPQEDMDEEGEDEASGKKRQDRSKHVQLFTVLIQIVLDSWRGGNAQLTNDYISGLNDLSVSIHQHGGKPLLALEYLLLTCPKL